MSLPDFNEKQILFVYGSKDMDNRLQFLNNNIVFIRDGKKINQISCYKVFVVFIVGEFSVTSALIKGCRKYGIALFLLKQNFEVYASINSTLDGNYLLRERQYRIDRDFEVAKNLVKNKAHNQFSLLKEAGKLIDFNVAYSNICLKISQANDSQELLGIEGSVSKGFFQEYFKEVNWVRRMPRTKYDINNTVMDIGYTFLFNFIDAMLNLYGFDNFKGCYHKLFFQRKSLSCDIMEPFRCLVDKQILKSFRLGQIKEKDFKLIGGKYVLSWENQSRYGKIFFDCLMGKKEEIFSFVKEFYYYTMNDEREFPFFKIK
jgi:CRISPR-associated protein Cas1